jgi:hypothetical protein
MSGLAHYIKNELFDRWKKDREERLEPKWHKNWDLFTANEDSQHFKPWKQNEGEDWRSSTFMKLGKSKIIQAWSLIVDMLLQGGKMPFSLDPSPWDRVQFEDMPPEMQKQIEDAIGDQRGLIDQQMRDCHAQHHLKMCVLSMGVYGETYAKKGVHLVTRKSFVPDGAGDFQEATEQKLQPAFEYVSLWNLFRDWEYDHPKEGVGAIERSLTSPYALRQLLMNDPYAIPEAVERAILRAEPGGGPSEGEDTGSLKPGLRDLSHRHETIPYLEFWGRVPEKVAVTFEKNPIDPAQLNQTYDQQEFDGREVEIHCQIAGDEVVRYARALGDKPLTAEDRPYYRAVWEIKLDDLGATGIADNVETTNRVLNGFVRAFEDNKKLTTNLTSVVKEQYLQPGERDEGEYPGKRIRVSEDVDDVRRVFMQVVYPDIGATCMDGISYFERKGDEESMIPRIMQGEVASKQKPDTLGELQMLFENAGKYLGGVIKQIDEGLIEPIVRDFYEYNMADPDIQRGKGNFIAKALGFTSFQNKVARVIQLEKALQYALMDERLSNETSLRRLLEEIYKALDVDADIAFKKPEEKAEEAEAMAAQQALVMQMQSLQAALTQSQVQAAEAKAMLDIEKSQTEDVKQRVMQLEVDLQAKELAIKAETARGQLEAPKQKEGKA